MREGLVTRPAPPLAFQPHAVPWGSALAHTRAQDISVMDLSRGPSEHSDHLLGKTEGSDKQKPFSLLLGQYYIFDKGNEGLSLTLHDSCHNDTLRQGQRARVSKKAPTPH